MAKGKGSEAPAAPKADALVLMKDQRLAQMPQWKKDMMAQAKAEAAQETVGIKAISHAQATLMIDKKKVEGNRISLVVIDYAYDKAYYESEEYDPTSKETPVCYAFKKPVLGEEVGAKGPQGMIPHPQAPKKQAATCDECPHNQFYTAAKGKGKRCKDGRRLIVLAGVTDPEQMKSMEILRLGVPAASLKGFGQYMKSLADITDDGSIRGVYTIVEPEVVPPPGQGYILTFKYGGSLPDPLYEAIVQKIPAVQGDLLAPYPVLAQEGEKQPLRPVKGQRPPRAK